MVGAFQGEVPSGLPVGEVTFLFTDVEGSTRLWEIDPDAMAAALQRHDSLVAAAVHEHQGVIVRSRGEGDSHFAVFSQPVLGVTAAAVLQRRLADEDWELPAGLSVRVALHHGPADMRGGSYYGPAVNRCARLRGVAHGGQVLLSESVVGLVEAELPPGTAIRDLGLHRLRDLSRREHVYQLDIDGLPVSFPPLASLDQMPHNLPTPMTSFIGRGREIEELRARLAEAKLVTLTGAGGCGKTRLGMQLAAEVVGSYPDGAWMVELASIKDADLVVRATANVLGVREEPGVDLFDTLRDWLRSRHLLLLLDNCEHLVGAVAGIVDRLLARCPTLTVLATSREPLGIAGEVTWRVPSLAHAEGEAVPEAVRLFIDRADAAGGTLARDPTELAAIGEICGRLDGIPLAIELAAARTRLLSVAQVHQRLDDRFRLLRGGGYAALPRHQTLEATVDWSYELLDEDERRLFRRLSTFSGGWTLEAAEGICGDAAVDPELILELLGQLVAKSLVVVERDSSETRYRMLETIRQYAARLLARDEGVDDLRTRHRAWYLALAEESERKLAAGQGAPWVQLDMEYDNLRAALESGLKEAPRSHDALRLAAALGNFWDLRCALAEGCHWLERVLRQSVDAPPGIRARALNGLGMLTSHQGDYRGAEGFFEEALSLARAAGEQQVVATTLGNLGWMLWSEGRAELARHHLEEGLELARELGDQWFVARALYLLNHAEASEASPRAAQVAEESLAIARALGEPSLQGRSLYFIGVVAMYHGDLEGARAPLEQSVAIARRVGDRWQLPWSISFLGGVELLAGRFESAQPHFEDALAIARETGNNWCVARCLGALAWCRVMTGEPAEALALAQEGLALSRRIGARVDSALAASFLGDYARGSGSPDEARRYHLEGLADNQALRNPWGVAQGLERLARLALDAGEPAEAAYLYGAASGLRVEHSCPVPPVAAGEVAHGVAAARKALGPGFDAAWAEGAAVAAARGVDLPPGRGTASPGGSIESAG